MFTKVTLATTAIVSLNNVLAKEFLPNMQKNLLPPEGSMWRGATIDGPDGGNWNGTDPDIFERKFGEPLHIFRNFHNKSNPFMKEEYEGKWIEKGGIVFYSFQPETWEPYTQASGSKDDEIRKYAQAVK